MLRLGSIMVGGLLMIGCSQKWNSPMATLKNDTNKPPETKVYEIEKGEVVYVFGSTDSANAFATADRKPAATLTKPKFSEQKYDVVFEDAGYVRRNALIAAYAKAHRLELN